MTDYRFEYYTGSNIQKHRKECEKLVKDLRDYKYIGEMFSNANYLVMCYDTNDNLAGFGVAYKHSVYGNEFGVYLEDSYFDDDIEKEEITKFLIYSYRDRMYNRDLQKQILSKKKRIVPVSSLNRDRVLIKNLKTSIVQ